MTRDRHDGRQARQRILGELAQEPSPEDCRELADRARKHLDSQIDAAVQIGAGDALHDAITEGWLRFR